MKIRILKKLKLLSNNIIFFNHLNSSNDLKPSQTFEFTTFSVKERTHPVR